MNLKKLLPFCAVVACLAFAAYLHAQWPTPCPRGFFTLWTMECGFDDDDCIAYGVWACQDDGDLDGLDTIPVGAHYWSFGGAGFQVRCCGQRVDLE